MSHFSKYSIHLSTAFVGRLGPLQARDDRSRQPFHAEGVVVDPPEINVRSSVAIGQGPVEMFRARFADGQATDAVKVSVLDGELPTFSCRIQFLGNDIFHHILPGVCRQFGIGPVRVNPTQLVRLERRAADDFLLVVFR